MDRLTLSDVHIGARVVDSDGADMGRVAALAGSHFSVEGSDGRSFWLSTSIVAAEDGERVALRFEAPQLALYEADSPVEDDAETARQTPDGEVPRPMSAE